MDFCVFLWTNYFLGGFSQIFGGCFKPPKPKKEKAKIRFEMQKKRGGIRRNNPVWSTMALAIQHRLPTGERVDGEEGGDLTGWNVVEILGG